MHPVHPLWCEGKVLSPGSAILTCTALLSCGRGGEYGDRLIITSHTLFLTLHVFESEQVTLYTWV